MDTWQLVHSDGEVIDADDASSVCKLHTVPFIFFF